MLQHLKRFLDDLAERQRQREVVCLLERIEHYGRMERAARRELARRLARDVMTRLQRAAS